MLNSIQKYTDYLFNCRFTDESFDPEDHEDHLKASWELFDKYDWDEIVPEWEDFLYNRCDAADDVINFVNLYFYYEAAEKIIPDPIKFISYLLYKVDMNKYWEEASELFTSLSITILSTNNLLTPQEAIYYDPSKDPRIISAIEKWKMHQGS